MMCEVRLFPWLKFTDVCEGDIRKPCYSKWVQGQTGLWAIASAHAPDRLPFEASLGRLEERQRLGSWLRQGSQPGFTMSARKASSTEGRRRRSPRRDGRGCPLNWLPQKWKQSQTMWQERIPLQTKKCKQKGQRGAKKKQAEAARN